MSEIVVGDIVARLRADSAQFTQAMQAATQQLAQLRQATTQTQHAQAASQQTTTQLAQQTRGLTQAVTQQSQAVGQATSAWRSMLNVAGGVGLATGISALVLQMKDFAVSVVDVGTRMQSLRTSLAALAQSSGAGAQQFQFLVVTAQQLGVALEPLARGWRTLTAAATQANLPLADQQRLLTALATEARRTGASSEELNRAILAVSQMASKGKVSMEELRQQLGEALVTSMAAAAKGMGQTTEELIKLVEAGSVRFPAFARALTRGFEEMQAASGKFTDGSREAFNRLGNAWTQLKDTIANSGLNQYLVAVTNNLREAVEWTNKLAAGGPLTTAAPPGPTMGEIGLSAEQQRRVGTFNRLIASEEAQPRNAPEYLQRLKEARDQILETVRATTDQSVAQAKVTQETNKTAAAQERQADFVQALAKSMDEMAKKAQDFRAQASLAPERFGRLGGTAEEADKFRAGLTGVIGQNVEDIAKTIQTRPAGTTVPAEQAAAFAAQRRELAALDAAQKASDEAELARAQAKREAATEARQAATQALQLDTRLEQLRAFTRRPSESSAEEARSRVLLQGAQQIQQLEQQIILLEKSEALQKARPQALPELRQLREQLQSATDAEAEQAYTKALEQQIQPLENLARGYGFASKAASDLATAQDEVMKLLGGPLEEQALAYLKVITDVAKVEAQLPQLRREAAASARVFEQSQAAGRFGQGIEDTLERLRLPREERTADRLRDQARRQQLTLTPEDETRLQAIAAQERFNALMQQAGQLGDQAAQTITTGLLSIVDGTQRVGEGFRAMAKSILDSMAQLTLNQGFRMLFSLGLNALSGGIGAGVGGESAVGAGINPIMFAAGGLVNKPTLSILGEAGPEYVVPAQQMQGLMSSAMRAAPSAGGQAAGGDVVIINVPNAAAGERAAAQQRALGRRVIMNYIQEDLSAGDGSTIRRSLRAGGG